MQAPSIAIEPKGDLTILERIAAGEKAAVEECIRTYNGLVWKIARKHSGNLEDAEDTVQEIFTSIWMNAHRFDASKSPETAFICLLAKRKSIDLFRKHRSRSSETELTEIENASKAKSSDYGNVILGMDLKTIKRALKNLPAAESEMIRLSVFGGNSHTEIAEQLELPLGTVKSKIRRGLNKIRNSVGETFLANMRKAYYGGVVTIINSLFFGAF